MQTLPQGWREMSFSWLSKQSPTRMGEKESQLTAPALFLLDWLLMFSIHVIQASGLIKPWSFLFSCSVCIWTQKANGHAHKQPCCTKGRRLYQYLHAKNGPHLLNSSNLELFFLHHSQVRFRNPFTWPTDSMRCSCSSQLSVKRDIKISCCRGNHSLLSNANMHLTLTGLHVAAVPALWKASDDCCVTRAAPTLRRGISRACWTRRCNSLICWRTRGGTGLQQAMIPWGSLKRDEKNSVCCIYGLC